MSDARKLLYSIIALHFYFLLEIIVLLSHIRIMRVSSEKDFDRTVDVLVRLAPLAEVAGAFATLLAFVSIVQGERVWLDVTYNVLRVWSIEGVEKEFARLKWFLGGFQLFIFLLLVFAFLFSNFADVSLRFNEGANLTTGLCMVFLFILTFFTRWKFSKVLRAHSQSLDAHMKKTLRTVSLVFMLSF